MTIYQRARKWLPALFLLMAGCVMGSNLCPDVDTACTDGQSVIVINQQFINTAEPEEMALVVLHETAHIVLKHRSERGSEPEQAADQWALDMLKPGFDFCRLARILRERNQLGRAAALCEGN